VTEEVDEQASAGNEGGAGTQPAEDAAHPALPSSSDGEPWFEPWHVGVLLSKRRSGKSTIEMVFAAQMLQQRLLLVDVKHAYRMPGAFVVHGADELALVPEDARLVHFIPTAVNAPKNRSRVSDEYDAVFAWAFAQTDVTVLLDECVPMPAPATGAPGMVIKYVEQGARLRNGILACSGRWRGLAVALKAHANMIGIFPGGLAADELEDAAKEMGEDLERAAGELGCRATRPLEQLRFLLAKTKEIGPYAVLLYLRDQSRFVMFQLPEEFVDDAIAFEVTP
jgi:hypothetical protein